MGRIPEPWLLTFFCGLLAALLSASTGFFLRSGILKSICGVTTVVGLLLVFLASLGWIWYERPEQTAEVAAFIGKWGLLIATLALLVGYLIDAGG